MRNRIGGLSEVPAVVRSAEDSVDVAYQALARHLEKTSNSHWETGQIFERLHEMRQTDDQIADHADMSRQRVNQIRLTCLTFATRVAKYKGKPPASFKHHLAAKDWPDAEKWLDWAEKQSLSVRQMELAREDSLPESPPESLPHGLDADCDSDDAPGEWHDVEPPEPPAIDAAMAEIAADPLPPVDPIDQAIANAPVVESFRQQLNKFARDLKAVEPDTPGMEKLAKARRRILRAIDELKAAVSCSIPCCKCTRCGGDKCEYCDNLGWIDTHTKTEWSNNR